MCLRAGLCHRSQLSCLAKIWAEATLFFLSQKKVIFLHRANGFIFYFYSCFIGICAARLYDSVVGFLPLSQFPYAQLLEVSYLFVQIFVSPPILDTFIFVSLCLCSRCPRSVLQASPCRGLSSSSGPLYWEGTHLYYMPSSSWHSGASWGPFCSLFDC